MGQIITVDFRNDTLFAVERDDGVFVAVKPICESIGIEWRKQQERIKRDPILAEGITMVGIPSPGGVQETTCLRLDLMNGWLFTIDESRVKDEEVRQKVLSYKRECYRVLADHFLGKVRSPSLSDKPVFPEWPMDEMRTKRGVADAYRLIYGSMAAQWIMPQLGFPIPPIETVEHGRQFTMTLVPCGKQDAA
jgi:hypothetical protein